MIPRLVLDVAIFHPPGTDEYFAYFRNNGKRYELNEVSFEILALMNGQFSVDEIRRTIAEQFEDAITFDEDLQNLLTDLITEGLITYEKDTYDA